MSNSKVAYLYNPDIVAYYYGQGHPMKPKRVAMTHSMILNYELDQQMDVYLTRKATDQEILVFHNRDYLKNLKKCSFTKTCFAKDLNLSAQNCDIPRIYEDLSSSNLGLWNARLLQPEVFMIDSITNETKKKKENDASWLLALFENDNLSQTSDDDRKMSTHSNQHIYKGDDFIESSTQKQDSLFVLKESQKAKDTDCPVFDGLYEFSMHCAGGSIDAAKLLSNQAADIVIHWGGGLHHAKRDGASGFCYINDIVLCILQLLRHYDRVLYIDIDVHHGDGVEEAFYQSNRVMTLSFHQYGSNYFPGSGSLNSTGSGCGKNYAINFPLKPGITDDDYQPWFESITRKTIDTFKPNVIVMQCGADSLANDKLGGFNLSTKCHGQCVKFVKSFLLPMIFLGGGGYTVCNVARCWTYETSLILNQTINNEIPSNDIFYEYYRPDYLL